MQDHPVTDDNCFIMMRFGNTVAHRRIADTIKESLAQWDLVVLRADDRQYHDELYSNIVTYMNGCGIGIGKKGKNKTRPTSVYVIINRIAG